MIFNSVSKRVVEILRVINTTFVTSITIIIIIIIVVIIISNINADGLCTGYAGDITSRSRARPETINYSKV
jgi:hypothetical protein